MALVDHTLETQYWFLYRESGQTPGCQWNLAACYLHPPSQLQFCLFERCDTISRSLIHHRNVGTTLSSTTSLEDQIRNIQCGSR